MEQTRRSENRKGVYRKQALLGWMFSILVAAVVAGVALPFLNYIAALVPFLVPQPVMMLRKAIVSRRAQKEADNG